LKYINEQQRELNALYKELKEVADRRKGDAMILEIDSSQMGQEEREALENEKAYIREMFEHPQIAKSLLEELQHLKSELLNLLVAQGENLLDYMDQADAESEAG